MYVLKKKDQHELTKEKRRVFLSSLVLLFAGGSFQRRGWPTSSQRLSAAFRPPVWKR